MFACRADDSRDGWGRDNLDLRAGRDQRPSLGVGDAPGVAVGKRQQPVGLGRGSGPRQLRGNVPSVPSLFRQRVKRHGN